MPEEKKKFKLGRYKNWFILAGVGIGGYFLYEKFVKPDLSALKADAKNAASKRPGVPAPDLNGPAVTFGEIARTESKICISQRDPRMVYAPVTSVIGGYATFSATSAGHFTRRLLCQGGKKWVEIHPA